MLKISLLRVGTFQFRGAQNGYRQGQTQEASGWYTGLLAPKQPWRDPFVLFLVLVAIYTCLHLLFCQTFPKKCLCLCPTPPQSALPWDGGNASNFDCSCTMSPAPSKGHLNTHAIDSRKSGEGWQNTLYTKLLVLSLVNHDDEQLCKCH